MSYPILTDPSELIIAPRWKLSIEGNEILCANIEFIDYLLGIWKQSPSVFCNSRESLGVCLFEYVSGEYVLVEKVQ
jgi:hypothetical protein